MDAPRSGPARTLLQFRVGVFVLVALTVFVGLVYFLGRQTGFFERQYHLVAGFTQIVFMASCNTTIQVSAPDHLRGRVMSLYALVFVGVHPFGALFTGGVAEKWGVGASCLWGGGMGLVMVSALALFWRRRV